MDKSYMKPSYPVSPSQMEALACLRHFYFKYVSDDFENLDLYSMPLQRGRDAHQIIEEYQRHLQHEKLETDYDWMKRRLEAYDPPSVEVFQDVSEACLNFTMNDIFDPDHMLVEYGMGMKQKDGRWANVSYKDPTAEFRGRPDRMVVTDLTGAIDDFKTNYYMPPAAEVARLPQLRMYAALLFAARPQLQEVTVSYRYIRYGGACRNITVERCDMPEIMAEAVRIKGVRDRALVRYAEACEVDVPEALDKWRKQWGNQDEHVALAAAKESAVETAFPLCPCSRCEWCFYPCPAKQALAQRPTVPVLADPKDAVEVAKMLLVAQAFTKQAQAALKKWCEVNGPVQVTSAIKVGFKPVVRSKYPLAYVVANRRDLDSLGVDLSKLDVSGLSDWLRIRKRDGKNQAADTPESAAVKERIKAGADKSTYTEFGEIKGGDDTDGE